VDLIQIFFEILHNVDEVDKSKFSFYFWQLYPYILL